MLEVSKNGARRVNGDKSGAERKVVGSIPEKDEKLPHVFSSFDCETFL